MRIGIKYCGGCNSRYDRTAIVEQLKKDLPDSEFVSADPSVEMDFVVVITGCQSACAKTDGLTGKYGQKTIKRQDAYADLLDELKRIQHEM